MPRRYSNLIFLVIFTIFISFVSSLYEDQIGKFDWRQQYIGKVKFWNLEASQSVAARRLHVGTHRNVVASINLKSGDAVWRHVMEEHGELVDMLHCGSYLVNVVKYRGLTLRVWDAMGGHLTWEEGILPLSNASVSITCNAQSKELLVLSEGSLTWHSITDGAVVRTKKLHEDVVENLMGVQYPHGNVIVVQRIAVPSIIHIVQFSPKGEVVANFTRDFPLPQTLKKHCLLMPATKDLICLNTAAKVFQSLHLDGNSAWITESFALLGISSDAAEAEGFRFQIVNSKTILLELENSEAHLFTNQNSRYSLKTKISKASVYSCMRDGDVSYIVTGTHTDQPFRNFNIRVYSIDGVEIENLRRSMHLAQHYGAPKSMLSYMFRKHDGQVMYRLIVHTEDDAIHHLQQNGPILWIREEALGNVLAAEVVDLPVSENQAKMEEEFGHQQRNVVEMFVKRITTQLSQLKAFVMNQIRASRGRAYQQYTNIEEDEDLSTSSSASQSAKNADELSATSVKGANADELDMTRDEFNLHKIIVVVTAAGKVFGMDSYTGRLVWKYFIPNAKPFHNDRVLLFQQRTTAHFPLLPQCVLIMQDKRTEKALLFPFNPVTGLPVNRQESGEPAVIALPYHLEQATMLYTTHDQHFLRPIILVDKQHEVHCYPPDYVLSLEQHPIHLFTIDQYNSSVARGYRVVARGSNAPVTYHTELVWKLALGYNSQHIIAWAMRPPLEHVHSVGRILGDRGVLYKYLNPNILAIITEGTDSQSQNTLVLYLIDVVVGKIIYSTQHKRCAGPVSLVHSEHWIVYSFYNQKSYRTEVVVLELYESDMGGNSQDGKASAGFAPSLDLKSVTQYIMNGVKSWFLPLFFDANEGEDVIGSTRSVFSSRARSSQELTPNVLRQAYILATPLRRMHVSLTEKGITAKSVLMALESGGILELPKAFLDPRRTLDMTAELREEGVEGYIPELPLSSQAIINYNQTIASARGMVTAPSGLESTSLVFVYGLDLFFARIAPSKMYDMLKEDFDYSFITLVTVGMIVGSIVTQRLAANKALRRAWQ